MKFSLYFNLLCFFSHYIQKRECFTVSLLTKALLKFNDPAAAALVSEPEEASSKASNVTPENATAQEIRLSLLAQKTNT